MDVLQCSHKEAVTRFLEAKKPIMVKVKRRSSGKDTKEEIHDQEEEVKEDKDFSSDEGLPIYPDFE